MSTESPDCQLCFSQDSPSLGSIFLLEWLTKLRETFYLPNYHIKGSDSGTSRWKKYIRQGLGKDSELTCSQHSLQTVSLWDFMETSLHRHDRLNHWSLVMSSTSSSFTFPGGGGEGGSVGRVGRWIGGWDTVLVRATSPHPYVQSKSHLINKISVPLSSLRKFQVF
ncbi:unnamed protein product [Rangifer tarandus platyrhynchus]|uniref:Uncharacterized protein n=1 Tax=Rangifer tarandus platyrhynchus TaxID=3082113 RepID=A0ABN8ZZT1_RANTA|nr:unnamed protein product [Rangifer tarandus platyrhynchus]